MSHTHERVECADCGAVVMQCRCIEGGRNVRKVPGPCWSCGKARLPTADPPKPEPSRG